MELDEEIQRLIALGTEGDYWDFKEMWHNNKASLLHDIICMANNQVNRDAYIILGVSDSKSPGGVKVKGVQESGRKDQQHLLDFLRNKKFAGGIRPSVYLQTLEIPDENGINQQIDVIVIKNSVKTPYFIVENYRDRDKEIRAGYIYTRIGDTNTAIDTIADLDKIEYLWRKRFGIDLSAIEKLLRLLDSPDDWEGDLNWGNFKYHKIFPEFQIRITSIDDQERFFDNSIIRNIADHQYNKKYVVSNVVITYHSTILYQDHVLYLDGGRHLIPFPQTHTVYQNEIIAQDPSLTYLHLNKNSVSGKLFNCFACIENNWYGEKWNLCPGIAFLIFQDEVEQKRFDIYVGEKLREVEEKYVEALNKKHYIRTPSTEDYFTGGWSKANEIKAWYLYEQYMGLTDNKLIDKLPKLINAKVNN